jgi:hypothetical protein
MRVECLTEERAPTLGPFLLYTAVISTNRVPTITLLKLGYPTKTEAKRS